MVENIFEIARELRRQLTPDAYMELIGRLLGNETLPKKHISITSGAIIPPSHEIHTVGNGEVIVKRKDNPPPFVRGGIGHV